jgi:prepilin-type N-terminal cleavage/methylation domain-containing protein
VRRGFSLAELLAAMALAAVLSVLLYQALRAAIGLTSRAGARSKAQMEATVTWNGLVRDLQASSPSQILFVDLPDPRPGQALLLPVLDTVSASGTREWSLNRVLLHWDRETQVLRRRLVPAPTLDVGNPLPGLLPVLQAPLKPADRSLSTCLKHFRATPSGTLVDVALTFSLSSGRELKLAGCIGARN